MRILIITLLFFISFHGSSQTGSDEVILFAQCMIDIDDAEEIKLLESEMKNNPYIKIIRLDIYTKRAFLLTKDLDELTEQEFASWFNSYSEKVRCTQIGRHGVDMVKPYPFEGCEK